MKKITQQQLYKRQTTLQEIGEEGQQKLLQTKVVVVGCGGLGNAAAVYLAASGIGHLHLVDFDTVSETNLHRQVFFKTEDVGKPKVDVLANHIKAISPFVEVTTTNIPITKNNVFDVIENADYVLDCTDSLPIKYLLNDACVLKGKPLIYGSLYKFDGYVSSFNIKASNGGYASNLRDAFPSPEGSGSKEAIPNCSEVGTLNTIVGIIGMLQANEVLKLVTGTGKPLVNELLIYNSLENSQFKMKLKPKDECHSERKRRISSLFEKESYFDASCDPEASGQEESLLISAEVLNEKLLNGKVKIISVIEDTNTPLPFEVDAKIPLSKLDVHQLAIDEESEYIMVCNKGISSYTATQKMKEKYPKLHVFSLKGGITNY